MEIVIKISEEMLEQIKNEALPFQDVDILCESVLNGTPLPKGHGRLGDLDAIGLTDFEIMTCEGDYKKGITMLIDKIENAPTLVEADRGIN